VGSVTPSAPQLPLPPTEVPQLPLPAPSAPQAPLPAPSAPPVPVPVPVPVPNVPHVPLPAPAAPRGNSYKPRGLPPTPASKPVQPVQSRPQASPPPAQQQASLGQSAPVAPDAVRAPAAGTHRAANRGRSRAHEHRRRQATQRTIKAPVTTLVTPLRKEPPTGLGQPALLDGAAVARSGGQPGLSFLIALPAIALVLPLLVVLFRSRRRF
jgi:hypothetical protein